MKRIIIALLALVMMLSLFGCNQNAAQWKDGTYTAEAESFDESSGWKDVVTVTVEGGKITEVDWNPVNAEGEDKKAVSESGGYGMVEKGGAQSDWHVQAALMEDKLIETQDPSKINVTSEGKADGVTGVSITVSSFVELAQKALEKAK